VLRLVRRPLPRSSLAMAVSVLSWCVGAEAAVAADAEGELALFRTARDVPLLAEEALKRLRQGNARYVGGEPLRCASASLRTALAEHGQNPMAVVLGCADSRCPVETMLDARPGDLFVLRNAGNACPCGEGSIVGSAEFAVGALGTKLVVVMGHTKCGAMKGASQLVVAARDGGEAKGAPENASALDKYLSDLAPAAEEAASRLGPQASVEEVAAVAVHTNVFHTIQSLLENSAILREKVRSGGVELHGAVYKIETGEVEFMGQHPDLERLLAAEKACTRCAAALGA